ncbi:hypothetical protein, variant [Aphanomyces invadans]|uniref:SET domain-containing protein n=1 Tax=Aphanomyces invadans TaxID=157072 RepID=A0A024UBG4_9STRA|nr:hypothetical protein, variant [Aphanomyces invadans]ETW03237.1 hypothetical protein, variant [Aphanomyces invadans]|eukprot:XP_008868621.1 hypothetical protein, variant [Aphanomyces invadans]
MSASTTPQTAAPDAMTCSSVVIADLKAWLQGHGVSLEHFGIHYYGPEEGHGVVAAKAFVQGEHTLDIPFRLTMNVHSALASDLAAVFSNETNLADIEILALHLMYEKQKGTASFWAPFIRSLPATFDTPIFWTDEPFNALKGTNVSLLASMMKQQIVADYTSIHTPIFQKYPALFHRASLTMQEYKWALSVIWSRAFGITKGGQYLQVLCPAMDMFNHDVLLNRPLDDFIVFDEQTQVRRPARPARCRAMESMFRCFATGYTSTASPTRRSTFATGRTRTQSSCTRTDLSFPATHAAASTFGSMYLRTTRTTSSKRCCSTRTT